MRLLQPQRTVYLNWLDLHKPIRYFGKCAPIYYMSEAGLSVVSRDLLENGADIHAQFGEYGNALEVASLSCDHSTAVLLLLKGADINAQCGKYGSALQAASSRGNRPIIQLLLAKGADVNA
jgi:ankyrin repeat protein